MPTEIYQFYIAPGSSNVSITAALFNVGGVTLDIETKAQSVATGNWEPFSVARSEIGALSAGQVIDFGTRKFAASFSDHEADGINLTSRSVGISGGRFSMGKTATWVDVGDGVYAADHDFSEYRSPMMYIVDENASSKPKMAIDPASPADMDIYRFVYNGNWFIVNNSNKGINNGVVHTVGGDNNSGSSITGWTITDASLKAEVNAFLAGVTANADAGPWTLIHSSANTVAPARITHWDNTTGGITLESFGTSTTTTYSGTYLEFALCGLPGQTLENGEYMIDFTQGVTTGRVLYKPTNGNASDGRIPVSDYCFKVGGAGNTYTINNVTIEGQGAIGSAPGAIRDSAGASSCTITNCTISEGSSFFRINYTPITVDKCSLKRSTGRAGAVVAGSTFTNNVIFHVEGFSGFLIQCQDGVTAIPHTYFANNVMSLEASTHGQGMSLYKDAWRNATVVHNIFYNCQRAHSFQPGSSQRPNTEAYAYKFENNLIAVDNVLDIQGFASGQKSFSFNGSVDTGLSGSNGAQTVDIRYNLLYVSDTVPTTFTLGNKKQLSTIDIGNIKHSSVTVESNIAALISASATADQNAGHTHANNLSTFHDSNSGSVSLTDKLIRRDTDLFLEPSTFQGKTVGGGAADGGALGVRWSTIPTSSQIQNIITNNDVNWASTYPALTLPAGGSYSNASYQKLEYGLTGGGTGDLGFWSDSNASWDSGGGVHTWATGASIMGASGWLPGSHRIHCSPNYGGDLVMFLWNFSGRDTEKTRFIEGISAEYLRLSVTVTKGGSGESTGYHAGATGQIYNYYWWPSTVSSFTSDTARWKVSQLGTGSAEWPNGGRTGSLWGDNPQYSVAFQSTPF